MGYSRKKYIYIYIYSLEFYYIFLIIKGIIKGIKFISTSSSVNYFL